MTNMNDYEIKKDMKHRCPINQMSVMMRKSAVFSVGGYQDWFCNEDYYLWIRMAMSGMRFENTPETLVKVRVNNEFYGRRGGLKYFRSEAGIQSLMFSRGLIGPGTFLVNVCKRFAVQLLLPRKLRQAVFRHFARKKCE